MNIGSKQLSVLVIVALLTCSVPNAQAATSQAQIDLNSLSFSYVDVYGKPNSSVLTLTPVATWVTSYALTTSNPRQEQVDGMTTYTVPANIEASSITSSAQGSAKIIENVASATSSSSAPAIPATAPYANANTNTVSFFDFSLSGQGGVMVTVNWSATGSGTSGDIVDYADSYFSTMITYLNSNQLGSTSTLEVNTVALGNFSRNGTLSMYIAAANGVDITTGELTIEFATNAYYNSYRSSVPTPAAGWLFGSTLLGIAGVARRKAA